MCDERHKELNKGAKMKLKELLEKAKNKDCVRFRFYNISDIADELRLPSADLGEETKNITHVELNGYTERSSYFYGHDALFLDDELICVRYCRGGNGDLYHWVSKEAYQKTYDYILSLVSHEHIRILTDEAMEIHLGDCLI